MRGTHLLVVLAVLTLGVASAKPPPGKRGKPDPCAGISVVSVTTASAGYLVTLRYKVVDVERAAPLFDKAVKPKLVDRASGAALPMPEDTKLGAMRSSPRAVLEVGKQYFVLFSNPDRVTKAGSNVDVQLGACRLTNLVVQ